VNLSETDRAAQWLGQFEMEDRPSAIALLDCLRFVPGAEVLSGVRRVVEEFLSDDPLRTPVAVVPILSIEDMLGVDKKLTPEPVVFDDFDPAQPIANEPGSEALMAHLIREVHTGSPATSFVSSPLTRDTMKEAGVRTLLCITDYIGSGRQVLRYIETWYRHKTIKSWRSLGWLKIVVVAYAATSDGKKLVEASPHVDELKVIEIAPGIEQLRRDVDGKIEEVCRIYARRGGLGYALGYRDSAGLFASSYSIPNNLPAILIESSVRWQSFFDGRSISANLADAIGDQRPAVDVPQQLMDAGQVRLAMRIRSGEIDHRWHDHLVVLALLPRDSTALALGLGIELTALRAILSSLEGLGLIDASHRPTVSGKRTLNAHRRNYRVSVAGLVADPSSYYPWYKR
jgi:hypothetical protein